MTDEQHSGGSGNGSGEGEQPTDESESGDTTVVIITDKYTRDAIVRLSGSMRKAADRCDRLGTVGGERPQESIHEDLVDAILHEIEEDLVEVEIHASGAKRGVSRLIAARRAERLKKIKKEP